MDVSLGVELGEEVQCALKRLTALLNTVVERLESIERELQHQSRTGPSIGDSTPTRAKPPLAIKVS